MAWLLREGQVLASLEVTESLRGRSRGLLGRDGADVATLLRRTRGVHSFGMRFPLDVAFLDRELVVISTARLRPNSLLLPRLKASSVLEAEAGAFERWVLRPGDHLETKE